MGNISSQENKSEAQNKHGLSRGKIDGINFSIAEAQPLSRVMIKKALQPSDENYAIASSAALLKRVIEYILEEKSIRYNIMTAKFEKPLYAYVKYTGESIVTQIGQDIYRAPLRNYGFDNFFSVTNLDFLQSMTYNSDRNSEQYVFILYNGFQSYEDLNKKENPHLELYKLLGRYQSPRLRVLLEGSKSKSFLDFILAIENVRDLFNDISSSDYGLYIGKFLSQSKTLINLDGKEDEYFRAIEYISKKRYINFDFISEHFEEIFNNFSINDTIKKMIRSIQQQTQDEFNMKLLELLKEYEFDGLRTLRELKYTYEIVQRHNAIYSEIYKKLLDEGLLPDGSKVKNEARKFYYQYEGRFMVHLKNIYRPKHAFYMKKILSKKITFDKVIKTFYDLAIRINKPEKFHLPRKLENIKIVFTSDNSSISPTYPSFDNRFSGGIPSLVSFIKAVFFSEHPKDSFDFQKICDEINNTITPVSVNGELVMHKPKASYWASDDADGELLAEKLYEMRSKRETFSMEDFLSKSDYLHYKVQKQEFPIQDVKCVKAGPNVCPYGKTYISKPVEKVEICDKEMRERYVFGADNIKHKDGIWEYAQYPELGRWKETELNICYNAIRLYNESVSSSREIFKPDINSSDVYDHDYNDVTFMYRIGEICPYLESDFFFGSDIFPQFIEYIQKNFEFECDQIEEYQILREAFKKSIRCFSPENLNSTIVEIWEDETTSLREAFHNIF